MIVSTIIPTIGRPSLDRAVESVLVQDLPGEFEIIVVNDTARALPPASWQQAKNVQIVRSYERERSVARNLGAALSRGRYLHFLDDDDWLHAGAFEALHQLSRNTDAAWLYGTTWLFDRNERPLIELHHDMVGNVSLQVMAGEHIHLQSSWINQETFFSVGGFDPLALYAEDIDLLRRIALQGDLACTDSLVACKLMGEEGSSTDFDLHADNARRARERPLEMRHAFRRLRASATSSFWHGRLVRLYWTSSLWNIKHRRLFMSISRWLTGLVAFLLAGINLFSPHFWSAIGHRYESFSYQRGFERAPLAINDDSIESSASSSGRRFRPDPSDSRPS